MQAVNDRSNEVEVLPDGKIRIRVTHLEMREKPNVSFVPPDGRSAQIVRAHRPTLSFYLYLYETVGRPWGWSLRDNQTDEQIQAVIQHDDTEIHVLYVDGVPAGFAELDFHHMPDVELIHFGLVPEFIGKRWGPVLLQHTIDAAWARSPKRFWLHTCSLDHPKAITLYQRAGFVPYKVEEIIKDDPRRKTRAGIGAGV